MGHKSQKELDKKLVEARKKIGEGATYYHYKDPTKYYMIESVGIIEDTEKICVCYRALYGKEILWVRDIANFTEKAEGNTPRFIKVD